MFAMQISALPSFFYQVPQDPEDPETVLQQKLMSKTEIERDGAMNALAVADGKALPSHRVFEQNAYNTHSSFGDQHQPIDIAALGIDPDQLVRRQRKVFYLFATCTLH